MSADFVLEILVYARVFFNLGWKYRFETIHRILKELKAFCFFILKGGKPNTPDYLFINIVKYLICNLSGVYYLTNTPGLRNMVYLGIVKKIKEQYTPVNFVYLVYTMYVSLFFTLYLMISKPEVYATRYIELFVVVLPPIFSL